MKFNVIILLIYFLCVKAYPQSNVKDIEDYYKKLNSYNQFNGCLLITKKESIIIESSYGKFDLKNNLRFSTDTRFYLGDISNQFISFAALRLIDEHKISETDYVKEYLPDFPFNDVQIKHLLTCTSGITDYKTWRGYVWESKKTLRPADIIYTLKKYSITPLYKAGKEYNFSNTNFVILRMIIEEITGKDIGSFLKEKIFLPLGLLDTEFTTSFSDTEYLKLGYIFSYDSMNYQSYQVQENIYDLDIERSIGTVVSSLKDLNKWFEVTSKLKISYEKYCLNPNIQFEQLFPLKNPKNNETFYWSSNILGNNIRIVFDINHSTSIIEYSNISSTYAKNDSSFFKISNQVLHDKLTTLPSISIDGKLKLNPEDYIELIDLSKETGFYLGKEEVLDLCDNLSKKNKTNLSIKILNYFFKDEYTAEYYFALAESYLALKDTVNAVTCLDNIISKNPSDYKAKILKNKIDPSFSWKFRYTKEQAIEDLGYLYSALTEHHPGLYDFTTKDKLDSVINNEIRSMPDSVNYYDFFQILSVIFPEIKDGHTDFGGSPRHSNDFLTHHIFFPLDVVNINDSLYVTKDCSSFGEIGLGAKIVAINNREVPAIISEIMGILSADGNILTSKSQTFKNSFRSLYVSAIENPTSYKVEFIPLNGITTKTIEIDALSIDSITKIRSIRYGKNEANKRNLTYKQINDDTGLMTIKTFDIFAFKAAGENFNHFLDSAFAQIKTDCIKNLIIDLRDNGGGRTPFGMLLYSYLTDSPFSYIDSTIVNEYSDKKYTDNYLRIPRIEDDKRSYVQLNNGQFLDNTYPLQYCNMIPENSYKGDVYILINGGSFSCTGLFCSIARKNKRAVFIGEESGSAYGGFSADPFRLLLPNTLFNVLISGMKFKIVVNGNLSRGVIPDFEVQPSIVDLLNNRDIELEFTLDLISNKEND